MSKKANPTAIGIFIFLGLALLVCGLLLFTSSKFFSRSRKCIIYFDSTLSVRAAQAERRWLRNAEASLQELPRRAEFERRWAAIEADLAALNADIEAACERVELPAFTAPAAVDSAPYSRSDGIIASSEWDFIDETENLRQRKSYGNGDAI